MPDYRNTVSLHPESVHHPARRRRVAIELVLLAVLTPLFLRYAPPQGSLFIMLAVLFLAFILAGARQTREHVWGVPPATARERQRHSLRVMLLVTVPVATGFIIAGAALHRDVSYTNLMLACAIYFPWALIQQTIFQFYLLGRLRALVPRVSPYLLAVGNGMAYGLVHSPHTVLVVLTALAGAVWSYTYLRDRLLVPIAVSHAILGVTYYYFVIGRDLVAELIAFSEAWR